ncbi:CinA family protein [Actinocrinis puniceicyclus]|uniref:CinA family protein n=1 Tax=Actinocrinis puniceicyclus TaxID=977794 RepID=A0A8J7WRN7_9ACTN|nr:CinA family protein [Actinocrinis puniceicyclus]
MTGDALVPAPDEQRLAELAEQLLARARYLRLTIAVAESLTGGQLAAQLTAVPGASAVFRGSVTAYATDLKAAVLGVDAVLLDQMGAVHAEVARQMAAGVRRVCRADIGIATTGVAGPRPQDGQPVGTVFVAVADQGTVESEQCRFGLGDGLPAQERARIQRLSVAAGLQLTLRHLGMRTRS